jgi:hypothetical protein
MMKRGSDIIFGFGLGMIFTNYIRSMTNKKYLDKSKEKLNTNY